MAYRGLTIEVPLTQIGLTGSKRGATDQQPRLRLARNLTFTRRTISKALGVTRYDTGAIAGTPKIVAGFDWEPSFTVHKQVIHALDGKLYKDDGAGDIDAVTLKSGLSTTARGYFTPGGQEAAAANRKLFFSNTVDAVQVLSGDGATTADLTSPPADWTLNNRPIWLGVHNNRLAGMGNANRPHHLYLSLTTNHENFTTTPLDFSIYPGVGQRLCAGVTFRGRLYLFKYPHGIFYLDDTDPATSAWQVRQLNPNVGVAQTPYAAVLIDNDVAFLGDNGHVYLLSAVEEFGDVRNADLTEALELSDFVADSVSLNLLDQARMAYNGDTKELWVAAPGTGATTNTRLMVYDFSGLPVIKARVDDYLVGESVWMHRHSGRDHLMLGTAVGTVHHHGSMTKSVAGASFTGEFATEYTDFAWSDQNLGQRRKLWDWLEVHGEKGGASSVAVDFFIDDVLVRSGQVYNLTTTGATLGSFILGTDKLGGEGFTFDSAPGIGEGVRFSVVVRNTGLNEDFSLTKLVFGLRPGKHGRR